MKETYRELKSQLDRVVHQIQDPQTDLEKAIDLHAEAEKIITKLEKYLDDVDKRIGKAGKDNTSNYPQKK